MPPFINVSQVTTGTEPPSEYTYATAGVWHNYALYSAAKRVQEIGPGAPLGEWTGYMTDLAQQKLPAEQAEVLQSIATILQEGESQEISQTIAQLKELFGSIADNPDLKDTHACLCASVAYNSGKFWSEVTVGDTGQPVERPVWLLYVCADVTGGLAGAGAGTIFGPWGIIIGGVLGAAAGSLAFEP